MNLKAQIEAMQQETLPTIPQAALDVMLTATRKLLASGVADGSKRVGDPAPDFSLENSRGEPVKLQALLQQGPVVLNFYRGAWCPYCNLELKAVDQAVPEIRSLGAELVSISPNLRERSAAFAAGNPFAFEILCDLDNRVARQYGLVFELAQELRPIYRQFGIDLPAFDGNERYELPIPATYVVDGDGMIRHAFVDADYTHRMEPAEIVSVLRGLS